MIHEQIYNALIKSELPCFYVSKKDEEAKEYIIFSYSENVSKLADCEESEIKYILYVNIYTKDDSRELKNKIIKFMKEVGFIRKNMPNVFYEETLDLFNQTIQFQAIKESEVL